MTSTKVKLRSADGNSILCWEGDLDKGQPGFKQDVESVGSKKFESIS